MKVDQRKSSVIIAGHQLPACALVCPPDEISPDASAQARTIGHCASNPNDHSVWVPLENGLLVEIGAANWLDCYLHVRECEKAWANDEWTWLPSGVRLRKGHLKVDDRIRAAGIWSWHRCDEEWLLEHILRLATKPIEGRASGPPCELKRLDW